MNLLHAGLAVAGSALVSKGVAAGIEAYAPEGVKSFLKVFGTSAEDVGKGAGSLARSFFGATEQDPLDISDLPTTRQIDPVSTAAARIAAAGKVNIIPFGNNNRVAELSARPGVQAKIAAIPTVGVPSARAIPANISIGKGAVGKVKVRGV